LPETICDLKNLEVLDLRDNKIEGLSAQFGNLRKLIKLNLDQNNLLQVPSTLGNLRSLQDLSLAKNRISEIEGDCLSWLSNLVMLDLHENKLIEFKGVPNSPKLDTLVLSFNQLRSVEGL
jgi:Leucine-rich repeat (LRR) protein